MRARGKGRLSPLELVQKWTEERSMRDYKQEFDARVAFIRGLVGASGCRGIVYGNSGGKDSALVGILCKAALSGHSGHHHALCLQPELRQRREDGLAVAPAV